MRSHLPLCFLQGISSFFNESTWWSFELVFLKKRGCTEIYPDGMFYSMFSPKFHSFIDKAKKGVLVAGKGEHDSSWPNTEQLHSKLQEMSDRIRNLEESLQAIHSENASHPDHHQPHPLMQPALLGIKSTMSLYNALAQTAPNHPKIGRAHV